MKAKLHNDLAYLYELPEFQSFKKYCEDKRAKYADAVLGVDMSEPGAPMKVAMLQGQAYAYEYIMLEFKNIHKKEMKKEDLK